MNSDFLEFRGVSKRFGPVRAVDGVSLGLKKGEFFSLLGPSGCGKTTMLRLAAGFEEPDAGRVFLDGRDITGLPPEKRKVNTIFQSYALFPHLNVRQNIAFGLTIARRPRREVDEEVERMLALIQMGEHADKRIDQISGGQKQRVAIARALAMEPRGLLCDEITSALDPELKHEVLGVLEELKADGLALIVVTHELGFARRSADRIVVLDGGRVIEDGPPEQVFEQPQTERARRFFRQVLA